MKKFVVAIIICICLSSPFWFGYIEESFLHQNQNPQQSEEKQVAIWKDSNFEKLIKIYLGKTDEDILLKELEDIIELKIISSSSIETNLKKIEIEDLERKNLGLGLITSMADIDNFVNLKKIEISSNHIEAIENVKIASNITDLDLTFNRLNDDSIFELKNYTALESLNLSNNYIKDISILKELKLLRILNLGYTGKIADNVYGCEEGKIDFAVIKELSLLEELCIPFSIIENIDQLSSLANLKTLVLAECSLPEEELLKVRNIQDLEEVDLYNIYITGELDTKINLALFSNMKNLKKLTVNKNIYNIEALSEDVELNIIPIPQ